MRKLAALVSFAVTLLVAIPSISAAFKNVEAGGSPPPFAMQDLAGAERSSTDLLAGRVTVIVFWATWSPRSMEVLADLEKLTAELGREKVQVVAINAEHPEISRTDQDKIRTVVGEVGSSATVLVDQGLVAFNDYGAMALPSMLVIDGSGKVTFTMAGYPTTMRTDLTDAVKIALGLVTKEETEVVEEYVPKNRALMYYNLGKRLYEKGQEEKGEGQLLQSVERDPEFIKPRLLLGVHYKKTGRLEEALAQFEEVKKLDPRDQEAGYQAAIITLQAGKYGEAEELFGNLHAEFPEREEFALGLSLAHKYQGRQEEYEKLRSAAAGLYPAEARYYYELGGVAEKEGDMAETASFYRQALAKAFAAARR